MCKDAQCSELSQDQDQLTLEINPTLKDMLTTNIEPKLMLSANESTEWPISSYLKAETEGISSPISQIVKLEVEACEDQPVVSKATV